MAKHARASFPILADEGHAVTSSYGLYDLLGDGVSVPAALFLNSDSELLGAYVGESIGDRLPADAIIDVLRRANGTAASTDS